MSITSDVSFRGTGNSVSLLKNSILKSSSASKENSPKRGKCKYNIRRLTSKGVILCLIWNLLVFSYQGFVGGTLVALVPGITKSHPWRLYVATVLLQKCLPFLIYPLAGWIADAKIGRYKVIRGSLWLIWIGSLLYLGVKTISYALKDVVLQYVTDYSTTPADEFQKVVTVVIYTLNVVGIAGFQANLIPFGVDQMEDGSSDQYSAFIHWYYWSRNGSVGVIVQLLIQSVRGYCEAEENAHTIEVTDRYNLVILLFQVGCVTMAVCLDLIFSNQVLNKDPKVHNPLKKVWKVSRFVIKHDRPVGYRQAHTYTYDDPLHRTDYAKKPYGGPFDSDYVEDVNTFWKMLVFIFMLGLGGVFLNDTVYYTIRLFVNHLELPPPSALSSCTTRHAIAELTYPMVFTLFIPLYEFFVYPFLRKYIPRMMVRIAIGMITMLLSAIGMLLMDAVGHASSDHSVCMFFRTHSDPSTLLNLPVSMGYAIPLIALMALGEMLTFISALEFIVAQSPFGMRGLLIGLFYFMNGIFDGLVGLLLFAVSTSFKDSQVAMRGLSCGSWYYLTAVTVGLVGVVLFILGSVWYKKRQRGGHRTLINHQTIIESYYETSAEISD